MSVQLRELGVARDYVSPHAALFDDERRRFGFFDTRLREVAAHVLDDTELIGRARAGGHRRFQGCVDLNDPAVKTRQLSFFRIFAAP